MRTRIQQLCLLLDADFGFDHSNYKKNRYPQKGLNKDVDLTLNWMGF